MAKLKCLLVFLCTAFSLYAEEPTPPKPTPVPPVETHLEMPPPEIPDAPISYEGAFVRMMLTVAGLIILIFLTVWLLRKLSQGRFGSGLSQKSIKILERRALSPKSVLYLVDIDGKRVVISESQYEVRRITTLSDESLGQDEG